MKLSQVVGVDRYGLAMPSERFELICEVEPATRPDLASVRPQVGEMTPVASAFLIPDNDVGRATVPSIAVAHEVAIEVARRGPEVRDKAVFTRPVLEPSEGLWNLPLNVFSARELLDGLDVLRSQTDGRVGSDRPAGSRPKP
jgi:hypothetical protein